MPMATGALLETERLALRCVALADLCDVARLKGDPAFMRFICDETV